MSVFLRCPRYKGIALVSVLLVIVIVTSLVGSLSRAIRFHLVLVQAEKSTIQFLSLQSAIVLWLRELLWQDQKQTIITSASSILWMPVTQIEIAGFKVSGQLSDEQAKFNLNNIFIHGFHMEDFQQFKRLVKRLNLPDYLWEGVLWYQAKEGSPLVHLSQISDWPQVSAKDIHMLSAWVNVLPSVTAININTAPRELLESLFPAIPSTVWGEVVAHRYKKPFYTLKELKPLVSQDIEAIEPYLAVKTHYFLLSGTAEIHQLKRKLAIVMRRSSSALPVVVWQSMAF